MPLKILLDSQYPPSFAEDFRERPRQSKPKCSANSTPFMNALYRGRSVTHKLIRCLLLITLAQSYEDILGERVPVVTLYFVTLVEDDCSFYFFIFFCSEVYSNSACCQVLLLNDFSRNCSSMMKSLSSKYITQYFFYL